MQAKLKTEVMGIGPENDVPVNFTGTKSKLLMKYCFVEQRSVAPCVF